MIYGHFFKLDRDSLLANGQVIFRYLPVGFKSDNGKDEYPYYPVYAVLGRYAIDFYYHAKDKAKSIKNDTHHVHIRLLHLPLSLNLSVKDNLTSILQNDVYNGKYKISAENKTDLKDNNSKTYWDLEVFKSKKFKKDEIYFRKLLLDFIYDLEHTHVFENSPHYEEAEVRLRENFLFNAIAAKAAYYWDRHNWTQSKNNLKDSKEAANGIIYAESLAASEKQWLRILRYESSCEYCSYPGGWFKKVEKEYGNAIFPNTYDRHEWRQILEKDSQKHRKSPNQEQNKNGENRHETDTMPAEKPAQTDHQPKKIEGKQGQKVSPFSPNSPNNDIHAKDNVNITRESVRWFLRRYNFISAAHLLWNFSRWRLLIPFLPLILGIGILSYIYPFNDTSYLSIKLCIYGLLVIVWLLIVVPLSFIGKLALPTFGMLMPRLIMAISSAWILFTTTEEMYKSSFDVTFSTGRWVALLIIPVMLFMMLEIHNIASDVNSFRIIFRCLAILGIGLVYSSLIGMFFMNFTANRILPRSDYLKTFYHELGNKEWNNPYENNEESIDIDCSKQLYDNLKRVHPKSNKGWPILIQTKIFSLHFDLLPRMLLFRAIFALFIGIFIQLIFEDKPITEPL